MSNQNAFLVRVISKVKHPLNVVLFFVTLFLFFFIPNIYNGLLLAPGDSFIQSVPSFLWGFDLWNPYLFSGFPQFADPQAMLWYPLRILMAPLSFNAFIVSAYVLAGCFTYGYVFKLTNKISVSLFSGIAYSMSGFMMAHLGHVNIIHAACWLPLILWGLENIKDKKNYWLVITAFGVFNCILAGHPQIMFYTLALSSLYIVFLSIRQNQFDWKLFIKCVSVIFSGVLLASIQLLPTFELMQQSVRSNMTFQTFNEYSIPIKQLIMLFFPYLFGGVREGIYGYGYSYFGKWNLTELTGYIGWLPIIFTIIVLFGKTFKSKYVLFWFTISAFSLLLTLGDSTPLSKLVFHIPGYNLFRVPARNFMEYSFAIAILGGLGLNKFLQMEIKKRLIVQGAFLVILNFSIIIYAAYPQLTQKAVEIGVTNLESNPFENKLVQIPLLLLIIDVIILCAFRLIRRKIMISMILILLIVELSSFGWFYEWRFDALPYPDIKKEGNIDTDDHRTLVLDGTNIPILNLKPNISQTFNVRSVVGYNPLLLRDYKSFIGVETNGIINSSLLNQNVLDLLSVKYLYQQKVFNQVKSEQITFINNTMNLHLTSNKQKSVAFSVDGFYADQLGIVMRMSNSIGLKDGTIIGNAKIQYENNSNEYVEIIVGRDVSEWAFDREDVSKIIQHKKANIFNSFSVEGDNSFSGHNYISFFPVSSTLKVRSIEIDVEDIPDVYLDIEKISLFNSKNKLSYHLSKNDVPFLIGDRWKEVSIGKENVVQHENSEVLSRVRAVNQVLSYPQNDILTIIKTGKLPNGTAFDPLKMALVGDDDNLEQYYSNKGDVRVLKESNDNLVIKSNFADTSFIIVSDVFYPGWKAYIDGVETEIHKTNYILRGVEVPGGEHKLELKFSPISFKNGLGMSLIGVFLVFGILFLANREGNKFKRQGDSDD